MDLSHSPQRHRTGTAPQNNIPTTTTTTTTMPPPDVPPPATITTASGETYSIGKMLGKGGFAKCYSCTNSGGEEYAVKVVLKSSLTKKGTERKLRSEIRIHSSLSHRYIVQFLKHIETPDSFYMILGLCENQTFVEMMRVRKHLTEPEVQYFGLQLLSGLRYLHEECRVIHRDLKLGNLFLTKDMEIRIGDFGLAASLERPEDRRTTTCGTPNYIAPEVLENFADGHSFEVDIWSFGVVLYTLLVGKPPFETTNVKATYKRIKATAFSFPETPVLSEAAKSLIRWILSKKPEMRPTLEQIARHSFFLSPRPPRFIPSSALTQAPVFTPDPLPPTSGFSMGGLEAQLGRMSLQQPQSQYPKHTLPPLQRSSNSAGSTASSSSSSSSSSAPVVPPTTTTQPPMQPPQSHQPNTESNGPGTPSTVRRQRQDAELHDLNELRARLEKSLSQPAAQQMSASDYENTSPTNAGGAAVGLSKTVSSPASAFPGVVVLKYVDYTATWGMGYLLSNGVMGARFNDATLISWALDTTHFHYVENEVARMYGLEEGSYPETLKKKVKLLRMFWDAIQKDMDQSEVPVPSPALRHSRNIADHDFVRKHLTAKHAIFFKLNGGVVQIKFFDKSELAVSAHSNLMLFGAKTGERSVTTLDLAVTQRRKDIYTRAHYLKNIVTQIVDARRRVGVAGV